MHNKYYAMRHGESKANQKGIILSDPSSGKLEEFSLTPKGEKQVFTSVVQARTKGLLDSSTLIVCSVFSRCIRSAQIAEQVLEAEPSIIDSRLNERWFGNWERQSNVHYQDVWTEDGWAPDHTLNAVESAVAVQKRTSELIQQLELAHQGRRILLVSHGDALQILQTWFAGLSAAKHRSLPHLETAEIRLLNVA